MRHISILFLSFIVGIFYDVSAQQTKESPKLKPPKMEAFWGMSRGGKLTVQEVAQIIDSVVLVLADRKEKLVISRAILVYRSKDQVEDEETGEIKIKYNSYSYNFRNTDRLPDQWKKFLKENIKPGDKLLIADILVKNRFNEIFNAGDINIIIE
jgi:hypothetical protein